MAVNLYEAMFVVDATRGGSRFPETVRHVVSLLTRNGAEIERIEKWEERKLAYPIRHVKRGIYILVHFSADGSAIRDMRRAIELSEDVLRVLILKAEQLSPVRGQLLTPEGELPEPEPVTVPDAEAEAPQAAGEQPEGSPEPPDKETERPPAEGQASERVEAEEVERVEEDL